MLPATRPEFPACRAKRPAPRVALRAQPDGLAGTGYAPVARLAAGGMGEVVEAERSGQRVVIKLMHEAIAGSPEMNDRMRIEAELLARLDHPNLVKVLGYGNTAAGRRYIVMEKLVGRTLRQELASRGPMPAEEAIEVVGQLLSALGELHRAGVVHRDVKPDNVMVCDAPDGRRTLKLLDLGIAKVLDGAPQRVGITPPEFRTRDGEYLGTPSYAAPEQALGRPIDARTDVYGAGLLLYALLIGRSLYDSSHRMDLDIEPPPPSARAPHPVSGELDRIVLKAIAKDPKDRFQTAAEFAQALHSVACGLPTPQTWVETGWFDLAGFHATLSNSAVRLTLASSRPTQRLERVAAAAGEHPRAEVSLASRERTLILGPEPARAGLGRVGYASVVITSAVLAAGLWAWMLLRIIG